MTPGASPGAAAGGCNYPNFMVNQTPAYGVRTKKSKSRARCKCGKKPCVCKSK